MRDGAKGADYCALLSMDGGINSSNTFTVYLLIYFIVPALRAVRLGLVSRSETRKGATHRSGETFSHFSAWRKKKTSLIMIKIINIPSPSDIGAGAVLPDMRQS